MNNSSQMQGSGHDASKNKYRGLFHSIFTESEGRLKGIKLKARAFQQLSYILSGQSHFHSHLKVDKVSPIPPVPMAIGGAFLVKAQHHVDPEDTALTYVEFHIPTSAVLFWFDIPDKYMNAHITKMDLPKAALHMEE